MTIHSVMPRTSKIQVDLSGPQGNAFYLLGLAKSLCDASDVEYEEVYRGMTSGDYEHLLQVFDAHFGDIVDLYRE